MNTTLAIGKLREAIRLKHLALATEDVYVHWLGRFCAWLKNAPESLSRERKIEGFLTALAKSGVSASTQNQAFNAILFFYRHVLREEIGRIDSLRAKRPAMIRTAPSVDEVRNVISSVQDLHGYRIRLIVKLLYGCGLRVSEPLNLRIKDVLIAESRLILRGAKGGKDRVVPIPCSIVSEIKQQTKHARVSWEQDSANKIPVPLPGLLDKKYPQSRFAWPWYWLFPSRSTCKHPRTGETVRWRIHEANVQRSVKAAAQQHGLCITPHHFRHAYATHALRNGASIRDLQESLGHSHINTTMGYTQPQSCNVPSPLELIS